MRKQGMMRRTVVTGAVVMMGLMSVVASEAEGEDVTVRITNLSPSGGTYLTPVWVGFHDGTFDVFDAGSAASAELERLAEDGNAGPLSTAFGGSGAGQVDGVIVSDGAMPPVAPGETATMMFDVDGSMASGRYLSFASMVIPSNDAFIGNGNPTAIEVFDGGGNFVGADMIVAGSQVWDAGTEVNDEEPMNTAFFGQTTADTGDDEGGVVGLHEGFMDAGSGGILDDPMFENADFTADGYQVARIEVVPEPGAVGLMGLGGLVLLGRRRRVRGAC